MKILTVGGIGLTGSNLGGTLPYTGQIGDSTERTR